MSHASFDSNHIMHLQLKLFINIYIEKILGDLKSLIFNDYERKSQFDHDKV